MTDVETRLLANAIVAQLRRTSKTIAELPLAESLNAADMIEISGGRSVSLASLLNWMVSGRYISKDADDEANGKITFNAGLVSDEAEIAKLIMSGNLLDYDAEKGAFHIHGNLYADGYISAFGLEDEESSPQFDVEKMWEALSGTVGSTQIAVEHLHDALADYALAVDLDSYVDRYTEQSIGGIKTFTQQPTVKLSSAPRICYKAGDTFYGYIGCNAANVPTFWASAGTDPKTLLHEGNFVNFVNKAYVDGLGIAAAKLATARNLWGNAFDGTADVAGAIKFASVEYINGTASLLTVGNTANGKGLTLTSGAETALSGVSVSISAGSNTSISAVGDLSLSSTNSKILAKSHIKLSDGKRLYFKDDNHYIELTADGFHFSHGVYSDAFMSAFGASASASAGLDTAGMWAELTAQGNMQIHPSHLQDALAGLGSASAISCTLWGQSFSGNNVSGDMTGVGNLTMAGDLYMANTKSLRFKDSGGAYREAMGYTNSNLLRIGYGQFASASSAYDTQINGKVLHLRSGANTESIKDTTIDENGWLNPYANICMKNNAAIYSKTSDGTTKAQMLKLSNGDLMMIGNTMFETNYCGGAEISFGGHHGKYGIRILTEQSGESWISKVGIDKWTPECSLHVGGDTKIDGTLTVLGATAFLEHATFSSGKNICWQLKIGSNSHSTSVPLVQASQSDGLVVGDDRFSTEIKGRGVEVKATNFMQVDAPLMEVLGDIKATGAIAALAVASSSDIRLKKDIKPLELDIEQVAMLPSVEYKWKASEEADCGTIAQQMQAVLPLCVKDIDGYLSVDYGKAGLLSAIAVAKKTVAHEERISKLEREVDALRSQHLN